MYRTPTGDCLQLGCECERLSITNSIRCNECLKYWHQECANFVGEPSYFVCLTCDPCAPFRVDQVANNFASLNITGNTSEGAYASAQSLSTDSIAPTPFRRTGTLPRRTTRSDSSLAVVRVGRKLFCSRLFIKLINSLRLRFRECQTLRMQFVFGTKNKQYVLEIERKSKNNNKDKTLSTNSTMS